MSHGQTWTHKTHHNPDLGEATTFPFIIYYVPLHEAHIQMTFCHGTLSHSIGNWVGWNGSPKIPKVGPPATLSVDLRLKWGLKQSCSPRQELFNGVLHATCTQGNWVDSQLLVVESQIANLTPDPSFGHNLCFRYPNGSCELILDIYVSISFQWYIELFNPFGFDPCNCFLNIQESTETPLGLQLPNWKLFGSVRVHSLTLSLTLGLPLLACNLANPCLGHEPKARVATI